MTAALRLDRRARAALRRRAPKPPTGAMLVYRIALRRALEAQQKRLWAIIEKNYEEPKKDGYDSSFTFTVDQADEGKAERYRRALLRGAEEAITSGAENGPKRADSLASHPIFRVDAPADGGASRLRGERLVVPPKVLGTVGERVAKQAAEETRRLLGVNPLTNQRKPGGISRASQGADEKTIAAFRKRNLSLIKRLEKQQVEELGDVLKEATAAGWTIARLRSVVMRRFEVARSHADLIARDQVLKLNGELQQMRQTKAGITEYVWSTSNDERVRPEHADLDGKRFSWDDPPESGANGEHEHPGQGISCRCVAIPVVPWLEED